MTRVKICGITRVDDAIAAAKAGADAIGLVFYPKSSRYVTATVAAEIVSELPPFVTTVGLFVNHSADQVNRICKQVELDLLQFHGDESPSDCSRFGKRFIKAVRMAPGRSVTEMMGQYRQATALLLDSFDADKYGGSGETFDWQRVPKDSGVPLVLAGGLNCSNVVDAVTRVQPYAVDVSSGVESAPGIKSADQIIEFVTRVKNCE
ncbi:MAG: phosphoribosylanthranilate isomerase [Immundisolibacteraceae bacterium]|nr:phosphoribosylanthranilate isomerase [Immundisolibacteraceae bacterium]